MKSARERAEEAWEAAANTSLVPGVALPLLERMFSEHATDQRTCCAAEVHGLDLGVACSDEAWTVRDECRKRALAAPSPGDKQ